jgi:hypothetical protein
MGPTLTFLANGAAAFLYRNFVSPTRRVSCDAMLILLLGLGPFALGPRLRMVQNFKTLFAGAISFWQMEDYILRFNRVLGYRFARNFIGTVKVENGRAGRG